jgi:hypothetical protein
MRKIANRELLDRCSVRRQTGTTKTATKQTKAVFTEIAADVHCYVRARGASVRASHSAESRAGDFVVYFRKQDDPVVDVGDILVMADERSFRVVFVATPGRHHLEVDAETYSGA